MREEVYHCHILYGALFTVVVILILLYYMYVVLYNISLLYSD